MKTKILIITLLLSVCSNSFAQIEHFWKKIETSTRDFYGTVNNYNGNFILFPFTEGKLFIQLVDETGHLLKTNLLVDSDEDAFYQTSVITQNDTILVYGMLFSENDTSLLFTKLDSDFEIIETISTPIENDLAYIGIEKLIRISDGYIGLGWGYSAGSFNLIYHWLVKLSPDFSIINTNFSNASLFLFYTNLLASPDKDEYYVYIRDEMSGGQSYRNTYNQNLDLIHQDPISHSTGSIEGEFYTKAISDTTYLLTYTSRPYPSPNLPYLSVRRFDNHNELINGQFGQYGINYYLAQSQAFDFITTDNIYLAAIQDYNSSANQPYQTTPSYIYLANTNLEMIHKWEKFYGGDIYYFVTSVTATPDGGAFVSGSSYDLGTVHDLDAWIIKVDSEGNLMEGTNGINEIVAHNAILYPNLAKEMLNLRTAVQYVPATLEVYNISGIKVLTENITATEQTINIASLTTGNYIFRIIFQNETIETGKFMVE